jgi:nitrous oxidase accessory protein NosD
MVASALITATAAVALPAQGAEQFRPAGLDPEWPECTRFGGVPSIGCAVDDVPGGQGNADKYVFLHGKALRSDGVAIENLNSVSPFGQGESIGRVSIGDHGGEQVATMLSAFSQGVGWWGVWVPVERANGDAIPPVSAWIAPMRGYTSLYNWESHTPPSPPPFGAESDPIGLGSGNRAVRVDDLVMPGPPKVQSGCSQIDYSVADGGTIRCTATGLPRPEGAANDFHWLWWHDSQEFAGDFERVLKPDGSYTVEVDATAPDGWVTHDRHTIVVSECGVSQCMGIEYTPLSDFADIDPDEQFSVPVTVTNLGRVPITDIDVTVFNLDPRMRVVTPADRIATLAPGAAAPVELTLVASEGGSYQPGIGATGKLPSGAERGANVDAFFQISGGDLVIRYDGPTNLPIGLSDVTLEVTNTTDEPITDVGVDALVEQGLLLEVTLTEDRPTVEPHQTLRVPVTLNGRSIGTTRVAFETFGITVDGGVNDHEVVELTVGEASGIVVNETTDEPDPDVRDGRCDVDGTENGDQCTLRAAIDESNERGGPDTITFDLSGGEILVGQDLPALIDPVVIDGAGAATIAGDGTGLAIATSDVAVRGLTLRGFTHAIGNLGSGTTLEGNTFVDNVVAVEVAGGSASIAGNVITGTGNTAPTGTDPSTFADAGVGVVVRQSTGAVTMTDNSFTQLQVGVAALADADLGSIAVRGGSFSQVFAGVIAFAESGRSIESLEIAGIPTFTATGAAVLVGGFVGPTSIHDNTVSAPLGVLAAETFEGLDIERNRATDCFVCVFGLSNDRFRVADNTITARGVAVVAVEVGAPTSGDIAGNQITGPMGILAAGQDHVGITGNRISGSASKIGMIVGAARDLTLTGNTVDGADAFGILLGHVALSVVSGNSIVNSGLALVGLGREPTPEEQAAFNASGATADELWAQMNTGDAVAYANGLSRGADMAPTSFYRAANLFERVDITGNQLEDNDLGLLLAGGPRAVLVSDNEIRGNEFGGVVLGAAPGENGPQSVEIRKNRMAGNGTKTPDGLFAPIPGLLLFQHSGLAYDYAFAKPHPNDANDADAGPNGMQNFPILGPVTSFADRTVVQGVLDSAANTTYLVDLYGNSACHASNHGEGETWLGEVTVTTDGSGHGTFTATLPRQALNTPLTATASAPTPVRRATSEFSPCAFPALGVGTSAAVPAGATVVPVTSNTGFAIGDAVAIEAGTPSEDRARIVGFGSLILDRPLRFAHPAGSTIEVLPAATNLAPVCVDRAFELAAGQGLSAQLSCTDEGAVTYAATPPVPAGATLAANGNLTYQPPAGFSGNVEVTFTATDAGGQSSQPARATITVRPPAATGMQLKVTSAVVVKNPRLPATFALAGTFKLAAGGSVRCGDDVTFDLEAGLWRQTLPGSAFKTVGKECVYFRTSGGVTVGVTFNPSKGTWIATFLGPKGALAGVTNPVAVGLRIGDDEGAATVNAKVQ